MQLDLKHRLATVPLIGMCMLFTAAIQAEPVGVQRTSGEFAGGWLFMDAGDRRCWVATPLHVARPRGQALASALTVVLPDERKVDADAPIIVDDVYDLAFYQVHLDTSRRPCTKSRLGLEQLRDLIRPGRMGTLISPHTSEFAMRKAQIITRDLDDDGGAMFTIGLAGDDQVKEGMSGSTLLIGDLPVGLLVRVVKNAPDQGVVLRFDVIRRLFRESTAVKPSASVAYAPPAAEISLLRGRPTEGGSIRHVTSREPVVVETENRTVELELTFPAPSRIAAVHLRATTAKGALRASVRTAATVQPGHDAWTFSTPCAGSAVLQCLVGRTVSAVRIRLISPQHDRLTIGDLRFH